MSRTIFCGGLLMLLGACGDTLPAYPARKAPSGLLANPASIAAGARIFAGRCASCHGKPAEGRSPRADFFWPPASDFTAPAYRDLDSAFLYWRIERGKTVEPYLSQGSVMPAWGHHLSETQIWQLVAYLRSRSGG